MGAAGIAAVRPPCLSTAAALARPATGPSVRPGRPAVLLVQHPRARRLPPGRGAGRRPGAGPDHGRGAAAGRAGGAVPRTACSTRSWPRATAPGPSVRAEITRWLSWEPLPGGHRGPADPGGATPSSGCRSPSPTTSTSTPRATTPATSARSSGPAPTRCRRSWLHQPAGYHGRAGSVVASGTAIRRPCGLRRAAPAGAPGVRPDRAARLRGRDRASWSGSRRCWASRWR